MVVALAMRVHSGGGVARLVPAVRRAIRLERESRRSSRAICVIFITLQNFFGTALEKG